MKPIARRRGLSVELTFPKIHAIKEATKKIASAPPAICAINPAIIHPHFSEHNLSISELISESKHNPFRG